MASFPADCPHCNVVQASFILVGARAWPASTYEVGTQIGTAKYKITAGGMCPKCSQPVSAVLQSVRHIPTVGIPGHVAGLVNGPFDLTSSDYEMIDSWPKPPEPRVPPHLPPQSDSAFRQGERSFKFKDVQAAVAMYGRALETGLKWRYPGVKGMLDARIKALVAARYLPETIGEWAHEVRAIRNDALHDMDDLEEPDMIAARDFADAVLRYTISLPADIALRRQLDAGSILTSQPEMSPDAES